MRDQLAGADPQPRGEALAAAPTYIAAEDLPALLPFRDDSEVSETLCMGGPLHYTTRVLRCKTPELIRKEIWTHIISYNLIRAIIAQAAMKHGIEPRTISFKGALQTLLAFQPLIKAIGRDDAKLRMEVFRQVLDAIATHRIANRPDRFEPRLRKRRDGAYDLLTKPRHVAKNEIQQKLNH